MDHGHQEPPQLWLNDKVPEEMSVPDKPLVRPLVEGKLEKVWLRLHEVLPPLEGVCEVKSVGEIESRRREDPVDHRQVLLVVLSLGVG